MREGYKKTRSEVIPEDWEIKKFNDVININPRKEQLEDDNAEVSFLAMADVSNGGRVINKQIKKYGEVKKGFTGFKTNDVLLAKITPCFENGKRALVKNLRNEVGFGSTEFHVLRGNKDLTSEYIYYYISTHDFKSKAEMNMTGSAGQRRVPTDFIKNFKLPVPPLKEQKKIASILSLVDEHIEEVDGMIEDLKELKKGLMQKLLTGQYTIENGKLVKTKEFKKTRLGVLPKHWQVKPMNKIIETLTDYVANGSFASIKENVEYKSTEDYAILLRLQDYSSRYLNKFVYITEEAYNFLEKSKVYPNDIIISNVGARCGITFRAPNLGKPMSLAPNSILLRTNQNNDFIYYWLTSHYGQSSLDSIKTTTAQPKFNKTDFRTVKCPIPPIREQQKIVEALQLLDERIEAYKNENRNLKKLKMGLMQQLLTGKVRVKV